MKKSHVIFAGILLLSFMLRFYRIGEVPVGFHRDEAFLGYNAYSILKTGKDISGQTYPLHLESYLNSPAGYSYLTIPFIALFGLNEFSVRAASAFFGALSAPLLFFLLRAILYKTKAQNQISLGAALLFALSPWHINLSRTATEHVPVVFFLLLATFLFIRWVRTSHIILLACAYLSFVATLTMYQAPRAFVPLFIPILAVFYWKQIRSKQNKILPIILYVFCIVLPVFLILRSPQLSLRMRSLSLINYPESQLTIDEYIREEKPESSYIAITRLFHNKPFIYLQHFMRNYSAHFTYDFLFTDKGLPDRFRVPGMGLLYLVELPLLLVGLVASIKHEPKVRNFLWSWLAISFIGSALTFDDIPNLQRTVVATPIIATLTFLGVEYICTQFSKKKVFLVSLATGLTVLMIYNVGYYIHQYYMHQPVHKPWMRQEGYKELVTRVTNLKQQYKNIIITSRESAPMIFFLFFSKYDPAQFQKETAGLQTQNSELVRFDRYEFSTEECPLQEKLVPDAETGKAVPQFTGVRDTLYVNSGPCDIPNKQTRLLTTISRGDNSAVFQILDVPN